MDPVKKLYCRVFQTVMRIALPLLPYREPVLLPHPDALPDALREKGVRKVLLVTDATVRSLGLTEPIEERLREAGLPYTVYDGTRQNPTTGNVEEALALYRSEGCSGLVAVGGGSSMDCAKAVGALIARPGRSLLSLEGILKVGRTTPPMAAVPTTAGTGSEATLAAILTEPTQRRKFPINDFPLMPDWAVLCPELTMSLPPDLTASTGMDAMTHAVEAFIGRSTTRQTREASIRAVKLILRYLPRAYEDPHDREAREAMQRAAYLAGFAFTRSYVGYVHGVAHTLGANYGVPHGLANAVLLPIVLEQYGAHAHRRLALLARAAEVSSDPDDAAAAKAMIARIRALNDSMGIPRTLPGIDSADIPRMARDADHEGNPLYPVPVLWGPEELERIYHLVQEETHHDRARDPKCSGEAA